MSPATCHLSVQPSFGDRSMVAEMSFSRTDKVLNGKFAIWCKCRPSSTTCPCIASWPNRLAKPSDSSVGVLAVAIVNGRFLVSFYRSGKNSNLLSGPIVLVFQAQLGNSFTKVIGKGSARCTVIIY